jgi:steroid delta-isomerase-like uncharacterized protein
MGNKAAVRRMFDEVINKGDVDLVDELFAPEFMTEAPQGPLDREGFKHYVLAWRAGFPDVNCAVDDLVEEDDRVAWRVRATGTHTGDFMGIPPTGNRVDFDSLNIAWFEDGRAQRHIVVMDTLKLMTQLGVVPDQAARV